MAWQDAVRQLGNWYADNITVYGAYMKPCPISGVGNVRTDCSGYVSACLRLAGILRSGDYVSGQFLKDAPAGKILEQAGFTPMRWTGFQNCQPFDILAKNGHVEIYAGNYKSWGWGSVHSRIVLCPDKYKDMPWGVDRKATYTWVWRLNGALNPTDYVAPAAPEQNNFRPPMLASNTGSTGMPTYTSAFADPQMNGLSITHNMDYQDDANHTRIYAATSPTIVVDELSMPLDDPQPTDGQRQYMPTT